MSNTPLALLGFISWALFLLVLMALVLLGARIVQSIIHLASTSAAAVTARIPAFAVQMAIAV
jgi:hypothetical protein